MLKVYGKRVVVIVDTFPKLSETFVYNRVRVLLEADYFVCVLCDKVEEGNSLNLLLSKFPLRLGILEAPWRLVASANPFGFLISLLKLVLRDFRGASLRYRRENFRSFVRAAGFTEALKKRGLLEFDAALCFFGHNGLVGIHLIHFNICKVSKTFMLGHDVTKTIKQGHIDYKPLVYKYSDVFVMSERMGSVLCGSFPCFRSKFYIDNVGVDVPNYSFRNNWYPLNFSPFKEKILFLSIGRFTEKKGFQIALKALDIISKENPLVEIEFRLVGGGPEEATYRTLVPAGERYTVQFLGPLPHKNCLLLMQESHFLLAPSHTSITGDEEGIPVVLMEAMASGLVCISTYHSGIPELICDEVTGFLSREGSVEDFACSIQRAINSSSARLNEIANAASLFVKEHYDMRKNLSSSLGVQGF